MIDAHLHVWDPERIRMAWLDEAPGLDRRLEEDQWLEDLGPYRDRIAAAVFVETDVDDGHEDAELDRMASLIEAPGPIEAAIAGWRPMQDLAAVSHRLDAIAGVAGVVGVRHVLHPRGVGAADLLDPAHVASVRLAGERGLLVELCVRPDQLEAASELVRRAPGTDFVLDHLGRPRTGLPPDPAWTESLGRLAAHPRLVVKMSALIECSEGAGWSAETLSPFVSATIDRFGCDRLVWGSNWPVCRIGGSLVGWLEASVAILQNRTAEERAAILGGNARRIYRLSAGSFRPPR